MKYQPRFFKLAVLTMPNGAFQSTFNQFSRLKGAGSVQRMGTAQNMAIPGIVETSAGQRFANAQGINTTMAGGQNAVGRGLKFDFSELGTVDPSSATGRYLRGTNVY